MENKQTAVEWLIEELGEYFPHEIGGIHLMVEQAKQMEKEQIINARIDGDEHHTFNSMMRESYANDYYNETYANDTITGLPEEDSKRRAWHY
jgi:hypothetical protein